MPVDVLASLSFASSAPWFWSVNAYPVESTNWTEYPPGARLLNKYRPPAFVVVEASRLLAQSKSLTVTPAIPGSPASWIPFLFTSCQTKSPSAAGGGVSVGTVNVAPIHANDAGRSPPCESACTVIEVAPAGIVTGSVSASNSAPCELAHGSTKLAVWPVSNASCSTLPRTPCGPPGSPTLPASVLRDPARSTAADGKVNVCGAVVSSGDGKFAKARSRPSFSPIVAAVPPPS